MHNIQDPKVLDLIQSLQDKYDKDGQDISTQLEGLLHSNYVNYWDYIEVETLLSLQKPKTNIPDEQIFIMYHQITELYFKLIILELNQLIEEGLNNDEFIIEKVGRVNNYFEQLVNSFEVMQKGLDRKQFLTFRLALLPSSGFQSVQFRFIEILSTEFSNLVEGKYRDYNLENEEALEEIYEKIYWKKGGKDLDSDKPVLGLIQFEEKYKQILISKAYEYRHKNLAYLWKKQSSRAHRNEVVEILRKFDALANLKWPLVHFRTAAKHLSKSTGDISSTGGTNWKTYLSAKFRKLMYFPDLWSQDEKDNWGQNEF